MLVIGGTDERERSRSPFFRGWRVVGGAFIVLMVGFGAIYAYAAFSEVLRTEFGASRTAVSMIFALSSFTCFGMSAISGPLADRIGPRILGVIGMAAVGVGLAATGWARSLVEICAIHALLIGAGVGCAYVPAIAAVQRWFVRRRGLASGIAACGIGLGTLVVPPAAEQLIDAAGWRGAFGMLGLIAAVLGIGGALLLDAAPERHGLHPDGDASPSPRAGGRPVADASVAEVLRTRDFWRLYAGAFLVSITMALPFAHLVAFGLDLGLSRNEAVSLICLIGLGSLAGRFGFGALADAVGRHATFTLCCAGLAATSVLWWAATGLATLSVFALAFGALNGGFVALLPAFLADRFGARSASGIIGLLYTGRGLATLIGPALAGAAFDGLGGYAVAILASGGLCAAGAIVVAGIGSPRRVRLRRSEAATVTYRARFIF